MLDRGGHLADRFVRNKYPKLFFVTFGERAQIKLNLIDKSYCSL